MNSSRFALKFSNRPECMKHNDNQQYVNLILSSVTLTLEAARYFLLHANNYGSSHTFKTTIPTYKSLLTHLWNCSPYFHLNANALHEIGIVRH